MGTPQLRVNYGTRPEKVACLFTSVVRFPGTSAFITQEYNSFLDFVQAVVPCPQATTAAPTTAMPTTTQACTRIPCHTLRWSVNHLRFIGTACLDEERTTCVTCLFQGWTWVPRFSAIHPPCKYKSCFIVGMLCTYLMRLE